MQCGGARPPDKPASCSVTVCRERSKRSERLTRLRVFWRARAAKWRSGEEELIAEATTALDDAAALDMAVPWSISFAAT